MCVGNDFSVSHCLFSPSSLPCLEKEPAAHVLRCNFHKTMHLHTLVFLEPAPGYLYPVSSWHSLLPERILERVTRIVLLVECSPYKREHVSLVFSPHIKNPGVLVQVCQPEPGKQREMDFQDLLVIQPFLLGQLCANGRLLCKGSKVRSCPNCLGKSEPFNMYWNVW